jgi:hypothetical protein
MAVVTFSVKQPTTAPVENALVRVYDSTDTEVAQGYTNINGELSLLLSDDDYLVRTRYDGEAYRVVSPQAFTVAGAAIIVNLELTILDKPVATHPKLCRVYGYILNQLGLPEPTPIRLALKEPYMFLDEAFLGFTGKLVPDEHGYLEQDVLRNREYTMIYGRFKDVDETIRVPDRAGAKLAEVLYPIPFSFTPTAAALLVGESFGFANLVVLMSDDDEELGNSVNFSYASADPGIAEVTGGRVVGVSAGVTTITMSFSDEYHDEFDVGDLTVTVT